MQEGGTSSSTDVAEPDTDSTEVDKTSQESVSVEHVEEFLMSWGPGARGFSPRHQGRGR